MTSAAAAVYRALFEDVSSLRVPVSVPVSSVMCVTAVILLVVCWYACCSGDADQKNAIWQLIQKCCPCVTSSSSKTNNGTWECCPKRRLRWEKCQRRRKWSLLCPTEKTCPLQRAAAYYKLHLPPPLPFIQNKRNSVVVEPETEGSSTATAHVSTSSSSPEAPGTYAAMPTRAVPKSPTDPSKDTDALQKDKEIVTIDIPPPQRLRLIPRASLMDLARMQQWKLILSLRPIRRRAAKHKDSEGLYPLHWAVSGGPPVEVVQTLIEAYPSAARKRDSEGSTPLHFASCYQASHAVHTVLLKLYPEAVTVADRYGRVPLYHAVEQGAGLAVLETLTTAAPELVTRPCTPPAATATHLLSMASSSSSSLTTRTPLFIAWANLSRRAKRHYKGKHWDKATFLLKAAYHWQKEQSSQEKWGSYSLLNAVIRLDAYLPNAVIDLVLASPIGRQEVALVDPITGQTPLHVVAATAAALSATTSSSTTTTHGHRRDDRYQQLLERVLQAHLPSAGVADADGNSPLALALRAGHFGRAAWQTLYQAAPFVVGWHDSRTGLTPALVAAAASVPAPSPDGDDKDEDHQHDPVCQDPCGLLSPKQQQELLIRCHHQDQLQEQCQAHQTEHTTAIFELLRADPTCFITAAKSQQ